MPPSTFALALLIFFPCVQPHAINPSVVPTTLLHHERRGIDKSTLLENGKAAQKLNAQFSHMNPNSTCQTGDMACIAGGFYQCVGGKFVGGPCAGGLKCFAMPLLLKKGTTLGCDTKADAMTRISNTGATGGLRGTSAPDTLSAHNSTKPSPAPISKVVKEAKTSSIDPSSPGSTNSASKSESESEKLDDSEDSNEDTGAGKKADMSSTGAKSSIPPAKSSPKNSNSTTSANKPKQVTELIDLDEMNITGP